MKNLFKNNIEKNYENIKIMEAEKAAKEICQYNGVDVYNMMKKEKMYAVVVDGIVIGGANNKKDAEEAVEFLKHFTNGKILDKNTLLTAQINAKEALQKAYEISDAEKSGTIKIKESFNIEGRGYVVDDTNELYTDEGEHVGNIADVMSAMETGGLTKELGMEIIISRINEFLEENCLYDDDEDDYDDDEDYDYDGE